jgi:hypothetical protein
MRLSAGGVAAPALYILLGLAFLALAYAAKRFGAQKWEEWDERGDFGDICQVFTFIVGIVGSVAGLCLVFANALGVAKPLIAPRVYLIEYFRQLVQ